MTQFVVTPPAGLYWEPSRLRTFDATPHYVIHKEQTFFFKDLEASIRFGNLIGFSNNDKYGLQIRQIDRANLLLVWINQNTLNISKWDGGALVSLASVNLNAPLVANFDYWIRATADDFTITAELWNTDPLAGGAPIKSVAHNLSSADQLKFDITTTYSNGFYLESSDNSAGAWVDDYRYSPLRLSGVNTLINNAGDFESEPIYELWGMMENPVIINNTTGEQMSFTATVPDNHVWQIDIEKRTVIDQNGDNKFQFLDETSKWPALVSGNNSIEIQADSNSPGARLRVLHRDAWV